MPSRASSEKLFSPKQVALALGVSEASVKRWCDSGKLATASRTAGGHRRISLPGVVQYIRDRELEFQRPEVLGLPPRGGTGDRQLARITKHMQQALLTGDTTRFRQLVANLYFDGVRCAEIFDRCLANVFVEIGCDWEHGDAEVYQERRACEICTRAVDELESMLPVPRREAPRAIGGTLAGDPYTLPTRLAAISLREVGWKAESYGVNLPAKTLCAAVRREEPGLVWLSFSAIEDPSTIVADVNNVCDAAQVIGAAVAIGGRALTPQLRRGMNHSSFCDSMTNLQTFARSLRPDEQARRAAD